LRSKPGPRARICFALLNHHLKTGLAEAQKFAIDSGNVSPHEVHSDIERGFVDRDLRREKCNPRAALFWQSISI
jgi:hypothetical protein